MTGRSRLGRCALLLALSGCASGPACPVDAGASVTYTTTWASSVDWDLDMVYVVDQSAATADWQPSSP
jgi:hypothetical protein